MDPIHWIAATTALAIISSLVALEARLLWKRRGEAVEGAKERPPGR